jgi:hypothetical protein
MQASADNQKKKKKSTVGEHEDTAEWQSVTLTSSKAVVPIETSAPVSTSSVLL